MTDRCEFAKNNPVVRQDFCRKRQDSCRIFAMVCCFFFVRDDVLKVLTKQTKYGSKYADSISAAQSNRNQKSFYHCIPLWV